jgi:hypothetical protein
VLAFGLWRLLVALALLLFAALLLRPQSWQNLEKRGRVGHSAAPGEYVSYVDLDATVTAIREYQNMQDQQITQIDERQKAVLKRLDAMESEKIEVRLEHVETMVNENQLWLRGAGIGIIGTFLAAALNVVLHWRGTRKDG